MNINEMQIRPPSRFLGLARTLQLPCLSSLHTWVCAVLCHLVLCFVVLCSAALCCVVLCYMYMYAVLHCTMLCCTVCWLCCAAYGALQCRVVLYCTGLSYHWFQSFVQPTSNSLISPVQLHPSLGHLIHSDKISRFIKLSLYTWNTKKKPTVSVAQLYSVQHDNALLALKSSTTP